MEFNNDIEFGELNKFSEEKDLKTLDVYQLMNRLEKSLSVSLDKVEKMLHKKLEACDLIWLCHIGIEIANAKFESSKKRRSAECDGSPPIKKKLMEIRNPNPIQNAIPIDLESRLTEMKYSSHTGPPGDLDDNKKRWLVVGICLHSILSPALRKYVEPVLTNFYKALKLSDKIDTQSHPRYLRTNGVRNVYLNYEPINMNKTTHGYRQHLYDYKVHNAADLSKLFLPTHMAHCTTFDGSCDSSALLGMIDKIDKFSGNIQTVANDIRSNIRNDWAHCDFPVWDTVKYAQSLQLIEDIIYLLNFDAADEKEMIEELDKWKKNGSSFLEGYTISFELVNEITQQIQVLVEYADFISKTSDKEFVKVHETLIHLTETLSQYGKRISTLENTVALQGKAIEVYGSVYGMFHCKTTG